MKENKVGVALEYSGEIPRILAIARGILFDKLIEIAKENNVTIYQDSDLAEVLSQLDVGSEIPDDLYKAVAEVLAYCYKINSEFRRKLDGAGIE